MSNSVACGRGLEPSLEVELCGRRLPNPVMLASGVLGASGSAVLRAIVSGAGAATFKSIGSKPRKGHPGPVLLPYEAGCLNAVGLSNPGVDDFFDEFKRARDGLIERNSRGALSVSVFAHEEEDFRGLVSRVEELEPDFIELNLSCPNVSDEFGRPFAMDAAATGAAVKSSRKATRRPLFAKLSAMAPKLIDVAKAALDGGADALVSTNTLGPGMEIDVKRRCPVLSNRVGGVSGAAIRPIALRSVWDLAQLNCPIIGVGGVSSGIHVAQMMMAGATAVQVGTALLGEGYRGLSRIVEEFRDFLREEKFERATDLLGVARCRGRG